MDFQDGVRLGVGDTVVLQENTGCASLDGLVVGVVVEVDDEGYTIDWRDESESRSWEAFEEFWPNAYWPAGHELPDTIDSKDSHSLLQLS